MSNTYNSREMRIVAIAYAIIGLEVGTFIGLVIGGLK